MFKGQFRRKEFLNRKLRLREYPDLRDKSVPQIEVRLYSATSLFYDPRIQSVARQSSTREFKGVYWKASSKTQKTYAISRFFS